VLYINHKWTVYINIDYLTISARTAENTQKYENTLQILDKADCTYKEEAEEEQ